MTPFADGGYQARPRRSGHRAIQSPGATPGERARDAESLGQFTAGVAHDVNNLLTAVLGHLRLLEGALPVGSEEACDLGLAARAAEQAGHLTRQLLAFGRREALQLVPTDVNAEVRTAHRIAKLAIPDAIEFRLDLDDRPCLAVANPTQIQQILLNLLLNARDAMDGEGTLKLRTRQAPVDEASPARPLVPAAGRYVCLTIADTGCGMDTETLHRAFEPFFSRKPDGSGSGLGLATIRGIVERHRGGIRVASEPGRGTRFDIYLPATDAVPAPVPPPEAPPACGSETVLVVEGNRALRSLVERVLRRHGYRVLIADHGDDAVGVATNHRGEIALLIAGSSRPDDLADELRQRLASRHPRLCTVLLGRGHGTTPGTFVVEKPFAPETLARQVRRALDAGRPGARIRAIDAARARHPQRR